MPEESEAGVHLCELMKASVQEEESMCQVQPHIKNLSLKQSSVKSKKGLERWLSG